MKTETEIRKLRKNTKTNREIRRQREKSEYVCFPLSWITTHTTHALDINELKCRCNMTAKCALFECRQMLAPRLGVAHFAYTTILHLIIAKRSQWHQQFLQKLNWQRRLPGLCFGVPLHNHVCFVDCLGMVSKDRFPRLRLTGNFAFLRPAIGEIYPSISSVR